MKDLPAAHSMDTAWFAVDADGHVGRFDTGEDGALPHGAAHQGGPSEPNFDVGSLTAALDERAGEELDEEGVYRERLPGIFEFTRDHGDDPGRYQRAHTPGRPVLLSELPPSSQEAIGRFSLPVRFSQAESVHLADHIEDSRASTWGDWPLRWPVEGPQEAFERRKRAEQARLRWPLVWVLLALVGLLILAWWSI